MYKNRQNNSNLVLYDDVSYPKPKNLRSQFGLAFISTLFCNSTREYLLLCCQQHPCWSELKSKKEISKSQHVKCDCARHRRRRKDEKEWFDSMDPHSIRQQDLLSGTVVAQYYYR